MKGLRFSWFSPSFKALLYRVCIFVTSFAVKFFVEFILLTTATMEKVFVPAARCSKAGLRFLLFTKQILLSPLSILCEWVTTNFFTIHLVLFLERMARIVKGQFLESLNLNLLRDSSDKFPLFLILSAKTQKSWYQRGTSTTSEWGTVLDKNLEPEMRSCNITGVEDLFHCFWKYHFL